MVGWRGVMGGRPWSVFVLMAMAGFGLLFGVVEVNGGQQAPQLPDEVRAWLEADQMQRWAGGMQLEWDEVRVLAAYVWSLENGDFLPRRGADRPSARR